MFSDLLFMLYPCYLTIESIRRPRNDQLKHCCIIWVLWYSLVWTGHFINTFLWWLPFISLFESCKLVILILALREDMAENIKSLLIQPLWQRIKKNLPKYIDKILAWLDKTIPRFQVYKDQALALYMLTKNVLEPKIKKVRLINTEKGEDQSESADLCQDKTQ